MVAPTHAGRQGAGAEKPAAGREWMWVCIPPPTKPRRRSRLRTAFLPVPARGAPDAPTWDAPLNRPVERRVKRDTGGGNRGQGRDGSTPGGSEEGGSGIAWRPWGETRCPRDLPHRPPTIVPPPDPAAPWPLRWPEPPPRNCSASCGRHRAPSATWPTGRGPGAGHGRGPGSGQRPRHRPRLSKTGERSKPSSNTGLQAVPAGQSGAMRSHQAVQQASASGSLQGTRLDGTQVYPW